ncbi:MAG: MbnP family protein [Sediminibacterium sp.]
MKSLSPVLFFMLVVVTGPGFVQKVQPAAASKKITLIFHHRIGNEELITGNSIKNILGETISVDRFRYYVSNFSITDDKGVNIKLPVEYFLVDEEDASTKTITLTIPAISVTHINFLLGVDSIRNVSGIQTGALDPVKGMFWTWNSGYVMAKLEGTSDESTSAGGRFTYHIGGFRKGMNTTKMIDLEIDNNHQSFEAVHISADINHWFKGSTELKISETPVCHSPGTLAMKIADNYSTMFSVNSIR